MANYNYNPYQAYMTPQIRPQPQYNEPMPMIKGRPVASFEEARASMIDFDGTVFYFPDLANQKIYTKQINLDGTPSIKIYELAKQQVPATPQTIPTEDLVTRKEFEDTIKGLLEQINNSKKEETKAEEQKPTDFKF